MKICVINFSGNVGKSTVAANLLNPRLPGADYFDVESLNQTASAGIETEVFKGKKFGEIVERVMIGESSIVDVGASNVEDFLKLMQQYAGSHEEFDFFVVPVVKDGKQQADTINTIRSLAAIGIPKKKIRLVFNKVETDDDLESEFAGLFGLAASEKTFTINPASVIYSNEIFDRLKSMHKSLRDVLDDQTDYRGQLREAKSDDEKQNLVGMVSLKRLAVTADKNLDDVFKATFK